ncbi:MAG TPA: ectonucleotide pyrophosphatase/phosphodiesterase [Gemmatimonadaceae bacterium]|nr:ectonucleotide pyrophosphatase/phosphodiesterase [Gemmatimonadaceae bacterium]
MGSLALDGSQPALHAASAPEARTVVVVSFDAMADRFLDRDSLPNFHRMMADGVRAPFRPEFPSKTFPNHYSMATGLTPGQHGIALNAFYDAQRAAWFSKTTVTDGTWFGGEPIWVTAERAGIHTAAYFWTGTEAAIDGTRPSYYHLFDATVPDSAKIAEIMRWLRLPAADRPRLVLMYSPVVDVPGHRYGPDGAETFAGVRAADKTVGELRDSLARLTSLSIDLVVVSDHGLAYVPRDHVTIMDSLVPRGVLVDDEHATFALWADPAGPRVDFDSLAAVYRTRVPHARVFTHGQFPAEWKTASNPRFGDLFMLADPGYEFSSSKMPLTMGEHGYDPASPLMMGSFIAVGPDFRGGVRLAARENRTLRDLLVRLLALNAAPTTTTTDFGLRR